MTMIDLTGKCFGRLAVISKVEGIFPDGKARWNCLCQCGRIVVVTGNALRSGNTKGCGCQRGAKPHDLSGRRFGRLTVISRADIKDRDQKVRWHCLCDCGKMIIVTGNALQRGNTKSCGCLRKDIMREAIHGVRETVYTDGTNIARLNDKPCGNNTSGVRGVSWNKASKKWRASIKYKGRAYYLGSSEDFNEAVRLRKEGEKRIWGGVRNGSIFS